MEWWIKKLREATTSTHTWAVLQSGQLTIVAELTPCARRLQEGDKLTPLCEEGIYLILTGIKGIKRKQLGLHYVKANCWSMPI